MSKTNHRRGFVDTRFNMGQRTSGRYVVFSNGRKAMDGTVVAAGATVTKESSRGIQQDRAGAKKFVHSRTRFRDRMGCAKVVREGCPEIE